MSGDETRVRVAARRLGKCALEHPLGCGLAYAPKGQYDRAIEDFARALVNLPERHFTVDYDAEADVLYISYVKPQRATDSEMLDSGVIINRRRGQVVGVTILGASKR